MERLEGLDEVMEEKQEAAPAEEKKKRPPFHLWTINGRDYKMKLQTGMIAALENKYHKNILSLVGEDDLPPLSVMLTIAQAALKPWHHGMKYQDVEKLYDAWVEHDEGNQMELLEKVIIPTMAASGFFTPIQAEEILEHLEKANDLI